MADAPPSLLDEDAEASPSTFDLLVEEPSDELGGGLFGELETQSHTCAKNPQVVSAIKCPHCHAMIPANSVRCPMCENNPAKPPKVKKDRKAAGGASLMDKLSGAGSAAAALSLGTLFSLIGAGLGVVIWVGIAMAINMSLGYEALILGALTGYGMVKGTKADSAFAGVIAAGIAFVGIFVAKVAVAVLVLLPQYISLAEAQQASMAGVAAASMDEMTEMRRELINDMTEEELETRGHDPFGRKTKRYYEDFATVNAANREKVDGWTDDQVRAEVERREAEAEHRMAESVERWRRTELAAHLAEKDLEARGVDTESESYLERHDALQAEKLKEIEIWSDARLQSEYAKYEAVRESQYRRSALASYMAHEELEQRGIEDHMPSYYQKYEEVRDTRMTELESWNDQRVTEELARYETMAAEKAGDALLEAVSEVPTTVWAVLFLMFFGTHGLLGLIIAMIAAYIIGCGSFESA